MALAEFRTNQNSGPRVLMVRTMPKQKMKQQTKSHTAGRNMQTSCSNRRIPNAIRAKIGQHSSFFLLPQEPVAGQHNLMLATRSMLASVSDKTKPRLSDGTCEHIDEGMRAQPPILQQSGGIGTSLNALFLGSNELLDLAITAATWQ
jgi:hypothetical protein